MTRDDDLAARRVRERFERLRYRKALTQISGQDSGILGEIARAALRSGQPERVFDVTDEKIVQPTTITGGSPEPYVYEYHGVTRAGSRSRQAADRKRARNDAISGMGQDDDDRY
jgi:hypothetical protein